MASVSTYLNFSRNTEEAFHFYKSVFGGEFATLQRFKDTPEAPKLPANEQDKIMHVALPIGKGQVLMGTDTLESMKQKLTVGNNFYLSLSADSEKEADTLFGKLSTGGKIEMPMQKTFWNSYFGMLKDKFGVQWMVSYDYPKDKK